MSTLTGTKPKDTYQGLIKTVDNGPVDSSKQLSDGDGNIIPITVSATEVRINGERSSFVHNQTVSAAEWNISHVMGKKPSVTTVDSTDRVVVGEVNYLDNENLVITFKYPFKGKAYLN
tara:strand:- start:419 stop:772 length:354 start_codon:yes stop_codon:yes gene_type:complete